MKLVHDGRGAVSNAAASEHHTAAQHSDACRLRAMFDQAEMGILVEDATGSLLYANPALARLLGLDDAAALHAAGSMLGFLDDDERGRWLGYGLARCGGGDAPSHYRVRVRHADGGIRVLHNVVTPMRWEGRIATQGVLVDVSEEVAARERARSAEQCLAQALQSIADGFVLFDADERLVICNGAYRELYPQGLRSRVVAGARFDDLLRACVAEGCFSDAIGQEERWIARRLAEYRNGRGSMEVRRRDGGWHRVQHHRLDDGATIVVCTDISELKAREAALEGSEARFRDYLASSSDWFWETDAAHRFTYLSSRFTELTGIPQSEFIGRFRGEVAPKGADPAVWQRHLEDLRAHRPFRGLRYWTEDRAGVRRHYEVSGVPLFGDDGRFAGYRGTGLDCTAEVQALEARERYQEAIENLSDGYALFDADDRLLAWNSAWVAFATPQAAPTLEAGMRFEDIVRRNVAHGLFPRAAGDPEGWIAQRMRLHRECREPFEIHRDTGNWYQVRERRTPQGGTMVTVGEVTELKRREQALRESEERFRDFAETAADWFFETDAELRFTFVSHRFESLTGIHPESLAGRPFASIAAPAPVEHAPVERVLAAMHARETLEDAEFEGLATLSDGVVHSISARAVFDADGRFAGYRGTGRDITEARKLSRQLAWQASHDELTGLVNRREFELRLARAVASAQGGAARHALCYVDLDQFKVLNDTCGHVAGDELLRRLGRTLKQKVRARDTLARLGGDEFALLLEHCSLEQAAAVAESVRTTVEGFEFAWDGKPFRVGASIGLVPIDGAHGDASQALRAADNACYLAKDGGRNRVHVYMPQDRGIARREGEMHWVARINRALAEDRLTLLAQPIVATPGAQAPESGARHELLLRLRDDDGTLIPPRAFLPAAERYGLANRVDRWVVEHVLGWLDAHRSHLSPDARLCVNLSGQSLNDGEFLAYLDARLRDDAPRARTLCFEVTETAAIANMHNAREFLGTLRSHGCEIALDDFGTGLSSFAYLRDLPVDYLKIDGSFIRGIEHDPVSLSIVRSINEIGHVLGKRTIAEYVENEAVARLVTGLGVDYLQGFGVGMPEPLDALLG